MALADGPKAKAVAEQPESSGPAEANGPQAEYVGEQLEGSAPPDPAAEQEAADSAMLFGISSG